MRSHHCLHRCDSTRIELLPAERSEGSLSIGVAHAHLTDDRQGAQACLLGVGGSAHVLDADTRRIQAELSSEQGLAQVTQYYVTLQKSLGLGWMTGG